MLMSTVSFNPMHPQKGASYYWVSEFKTVCKSFNLYIMLANYETVCSDLFSSHNQRTPLHMAVKGGHMDIVEHLIVERDADINSKDIKGVSPSSYSNIL